MAETRRIMRRAGAEILGRLVGVAIVSLVIFHLARWITEATFLEQRFDDVLTRLQVQADPHPDIMLIAIDQAAIDRHGSWPFAFDHLLTLSDKLVAQGARAVVFIDPVLRQEDGLEQVARLRRLEDQATICVPHMVRLDPFAEPRVDVVLSGDELVDRFKSGISLVDPNADGVVRTARLGYQVGEVVYPALVLEVAQQLSEEAMPAPDPDAMLTISFTGPSRTLPSVAWNQVMDEQVGANVLQDKICFVGLYEPSLIGSLTTPLSDAPFYSAPVEIHASTLDTLLSDRWGPTLSVWVLSLLAVGITIWLTIMYRRLRPLGLLVLIAVYILLVPALALGIRQFLHIQVPVLAYVIMGVVVLLTSLINQLMRYQDDLLNLLNVLQRTHWLLPDNVNSQVLGDRGLGDLIGSINDLIHANGVILARTGGGGRLIVLAASGFPAGGGLESGEVLEPIPVDEVAVIDGDLLSEHLHGRLWAVPVHGSGQSGGWLLVRLEDMTRIRQAEVMVQGLSTHLGRMLGDAQTRRWRMPDLRILRIFRSHYMADITERLEGLRTRDRNEREIITLMLDMTQVGLVLADSVGRVQFKNRFCEEVLADVALEWDGESAIGLIRAMAARQQQAEDEQSIRDCFRAGKGRTFTLSSKREDGDSYMVQVWPFLHDPLDAEDEEVGFRSMATDTMTIGRMPSWPDHFIISMSNITAFKQVDRLKSELIEMIAFKCRNHMSSILVCSDLLKQDPAMALDVVPELRKTAANLDNIFEQFRHSAHFSIDYQDADQAVPLNLLRVVRETVRQLHHLSDRQQVPFSIEEGKLLESAFVAERPLRKALEDLFSACLHASRPKQVIQLRLDEGAGRLSIEVLMPECTLLVALRRFPITHLQGVEEYDSLFAGDMGEGDLSLQAAALMPDIHNNLKSIGCSFRAVEYQENGLLFQIRVPELA